MLSFIHMNNNGAIDFSRSTLFTVSTCASSICNYTLPFELFAGLYRVLVYDTDVYGTLPSGISYPAASQEFQTSGNTQGITLYSVYIYKAKVFHLSQLCLRQKFSCSRFVL